MLTDRVSNPGPLSYESRALPIALRGPARSKRNLKRFAPIDKGGYKKWRISLS